MGKGDRVGQGPFVRWVLPRQEHPAFGVKACRWLNTDKVMVIVLHKRIVNPINESGATEKVTSEEIEEWNENHDEPHPVFRVEHRPERINLNGYRPPSETVAHMDPTANHDGLERRVCPTCRLFFDTGEDSDSVFCGGSCRRRYERWDWTER